MRNLRNKIKSNHLFFKIVLFSTVLVTLSIGAVSSLLYNRFVHTAISQAYDSAQKLLLQTSRSSDFLYNLTTSFGNTLLGDSDVVKALYADNLTSHDVHMVDMKLTKMMASNPAVHSVYLYNKQLDKYVSTTLNVEQYDREFIQQKDQFLKDRYRFIPRTLTYSSNGKIVQSNVLTYIFSDLPSYAPGTDSSVIVNVSVNYLRSLIDSMNASDSSFVLIVDRNGAVISHPDDAAFDLDRTGHALVQQLLAEKGASGEFITEATNRKTLVTYVVSPGLGWTFISLTSYDYLTTGMHKLKSIVWTICGAVLLSAVFASLWIGRKIYSPFDKLVAKLKQSSKESQPILKENFLKQLLNDRPTDMRTLENKFKFLDISLNTHGFVVLLLKIDRFESFKRSYDEKTRTLLHFAVRNIASEVASRWASNECVMMDDNVAVLIMNTEGSSGTVSEDDLIVASETIQAAIAEYLKFTVTVAVGDSVEDASQLGRSFQSALEMVQYRFLWGWASVLHKEKIAHNLERDFAYPAALEKKLLEAVKSNDAGGTADALRKMTDMAKMMTYEHAIFMLTRLSIHSGELAKSLHVNEYNPDFPAGLIRDAEWIGEVERKLLEYYAEIGRKIVDKRHNKNIVLMERILEYLEENYGDPNLSSDFIADMLGISPQYFSRLFKEITGHNYSEYLSELRLNKSKELLSQGAYSIDEVSKRTGFSSQSYFALRFRKKFGITPNEFRAGNKTIGKV